MIYEKYIIVTDGIESTNKIVDLLGQSNMLNAYKALTLDIILIDSSCGEQDWVETIKNHLNLDVKVTSFADFKWADNTPQEITDAFNQFIADVDISDDLNYFLDLISEKGSEDLLTPKERQRLWFLSDNI
jgi:hypothetical protein